MYKSSLIFLLIILISCDPDEQDPCSLDHLDLSTYKGFSTVCNGIPGSQIDFGAKVIMSVDDTSLTFNIIDTISNVNYSQSISLISECIEGEPNVFHHELIDPITNQDVGTLHTKGTILYLSLERTPCETSIHFSGILKPE